MSLLLSPIILFLVGVVIARASKARRIWKRHGLFALRAGVLSLVAYSVFLLALLVDHAWTHGVALALGASTGTEWVVNSGLLVFEAAWPLADPGVVVFVVVGFMLLPLWLYIGVEAGFWLFGRSPKQTGIMGLLR